MRRPDAILFDLWGTLIGSEGFNPGLGNAAVLEGCDNPRGVSLSQVMELADRVVTELEPREDQVALEFTQASLLRLLIDCLGLAPRCSVEELEWVFWQASLQVRLMEGVPAMLSALGELGIPGAVVSNSSFRSETLRRELERQGILGHLQFVISSADYGVRKPDPLIFEAALRRLGTQAARTWFVGDHVGYDILGASGAGLFPIAYGSREPVPPSAGRHALISHWNQLIPLVESPEPDRGR